MVEIEQFQMPFNDPRKEAAPREITKRGWAIISILDAAVYSKRTSRTELAKIRKACKALELNPEEVYRVLYACEYFDDVVARLDKKEALV